jgi:hypothetical protein
VSNVSTTRREKNPDAVAAAAAAADDDHAKKVESALVRAQWFVIQTGLITTGLALFGVYVLANRINDMHVMTLYVLKYIPAGPIIIGVIAASGYTLGAWWSGVRVRGGLLITVLVLQLAAYMLAQYTEFASLNLRYPDTGNDVEFTTYFHHTTMSLVSYLHEGMAMRSSAWGYALRAMEAVLFSVGAVASALVLVGQPTCPVCRGLLQRKRVATVSSSAAPAALARMSELARQGDVSRFADAVRVYDEGAAGPPADDPPLDLCVRRCKACGYGYVEVETARAQGFLVGTPPPRTDVTSEFAATLFKPKGRSLWHHPFTSRP